ncbi:hypothetical protein SFC88_16290 [Nocardioides sp. HM23]|uniref:hypothetical protein n=1 Tax=Nocardioides bizhenqiangii TaxID=3095076 RepID=UPI002ACAB621|nr:hypothetical protein [Nocardioides sp. HM23]MDZ5622404.1 hypothetical protein [Nocardioides sp. HM23]
MSDPAHIIWVFGTAMLVVLLLAIGALALADAFGREAQSGGRGRSTTRDGRTPC